MPRAGGRSGQCWDHVALYSHGHPCTPAEPAGSFRAQQQTDRDEWWLLMLPQQASVTPSFHKQNSIDLTLIRRICLSNLCARPAQWLWCCCQRGLPRQGSQGAANMLGTCHKLLTAPNNGLSLMSTIFPSHSLWLGREV